MAVSEVFPNRTSELLEMSTTTVALEDYTQVALAEGQQDPTNVSYTLDEFLHQGIGYFGYDEAKVRNIRKLDWTGLNWTGLPLNNLKIFLHDSCTRYATMFIYMYHVLPDDVKTIWKECLKNASGIQREFI